MPSNLRRYQHEGDDHFITFSCHDRKPYLNTPAARDAFLSCLERTRKRYKFEVLGYVVMPEHVHLLLSEPAEEPLSKAIQALKLSISKLSSQHPFWLTRYYDFNVFSHNKRVEKLRYRRYVCVRSGGKELPPHNGKQRSLLLAERVIRRREFQNMHRS